MITVQPLTLYEFLSLIISIAGFTSVIISIFVLNKSVGSDAYQASANQMFLLDQMMINNPELRPYFYAGKEVSLDDPNYEKVLAMAELIQDFFGSILVQSRRFPHIWPRNWWIPYFKDVFCNSPVLCSYLETTADWYHDELINLMKEGKRLRQEKELKKTTLEKLAVIAQTDSSEQASEKELSDS